MVEDTVIRAEELGKKYIIGHESERESYTALRDVAARAARNLWKRAVDAARGRAIMRGEATEEIWALKDVSFEVKRGDVLGIIGRNGAGKSTLLKILSRITEPSEGRVTIVGRVASLLEVGTGFHPELTGRENIYLNGAILGMSRAEIRRKFDEIVDFSGVEKFIDTPVKRYSSGMQVRLAFSVAGHLEPEILVVDEVLAVGDFEFQKKCLGKMQEVVTNQGRTILFVSHNMEAVRNLCSRGLLLSEGKIGFDGEIGSCVHIYQSGKISATGAKWIRHGASELPTLGFNQIEVELRGRQPTHVLQIECSFTGNPIRRPAMVAFDIKDSHGVTLMQALPATGAFLTLTNSRCDVRFRVSLPPLVPGRYWVTAWVGPNHIETFDLCEDCVSFEIQESPTPGRIIPHGRDHGFLVPSCTYEAL